MRTATQRTTYSRGSRDLPYLITISVFLIFWQWINNFCKSLCASDIWFWACSTIAFLTQRQNKHKCSRWCFVSRAPFRVGVYFLNRPANLPGGRTVPDTIFVKKGKKVFVCKHMCIHLPPPTHTRTQKSEIVCISMLVIILGWNLFCSFYSSVFSNFPEQTGNKYVRSLFLN